MMKVLITDDHPVVRRGIRKILESEAGLSQVHEAGNEEELIRELENLLFDVVLLDISLPGRSGLEMISQIRKKQPSAAILMLTVHHEAAYAIQALKLGAAGYMVKTSAPDELVAAVRKVVAGETYISVDIAEKLAECYVSTSKPEVQLRLSRREIQVLRFFATGMTISHMASHLGLSPKTVSTYRERLLTKLNLRSTAELIRFSITNGFDKSLLSVK
jgi:two-component system, NarL family, invasion response regulator UvrY